MKKSNLKKAILLGLVCSNIFAASAWASGTEIKPAPKEDGNILLVEATKYTLNGVETSEISSYSNVYGGYTAGSENVSDNVLTISSGTITGEVYAGYSESGSTENNTLRWSGGTISGSTICANAIVINGDVNYAGGSGTMTADGAVVFSGGTFTIGTGSTASNLIVNSGNGSIFLGVDKTGSLIGGSASVSTLTGNVFNGGTLTITNLNVVGSVYARDIDGSSNNCLTISGGTVSKSVCGGRSESGVIEDNKVTLTNVSVQNYVYGGVSVDGFTATGNEVTINGGNLIKAVYGGYSYASAGYTGQSGMVIENCVKITGGKFDDFVYGGKSDSGEVISNSVDIDGGTFSSNIYGGISVSGQVMSNSVNIENGSFSSYIYGGRSDSGEVISNSVDVDGGTFSSTIYGGIGVSGQAIGNRICIAGGSFEQNVYGGYSKSNNSLRNYVLIRGGTFSKDIYGGYAYNADKNGDNNTVVISGSNISFTGGVPHYIYGGVSIGSTTNSKNNAVQISESVTLSGVNLRGSQKLTTGNTLVIDAKDVTTGTVVHFSNYAFSIPDTITNGGTMLSSSNTITLSESNGILVSPYYGLSSGDKVILANKVSGTVTSTLTFDLAPGNEMSGGSVAIESGKLVFTMGTIDQWTSVQPSSLTGNTVSVSNDTTATVNEETQTLKDTSATLVTNWQDIYGGYTTAQSAYVGNNTVTIGGSLTTGATDSSTYIYGGYSGNGIAANNKITIDGEELTASKHLNVYGGLGGNSADDNTLSIKGGSLASSTGQIFLYGGTSSNYASGNSVEISVGTIGSESSKGVNVIYGASATNGVSNNKITITGGSITGVFNGVSNGMKLYAGQSDSGSATSNSVEISGGVLTNVGYFEGGHSDYGDAISNKILITDGSIVGINTGMDLYGGNGCGSATSNNVVISDDGVLTNVKNLVGGCACNNVDVTGNKILITGGSIGGISTGMSLYGGKSYYLSYGGSNGKAAIENEISISGGTLSSTKVIYGGYGWTGASSNKVTITSANMGTVSGDDIGSVIGGYAVTSGDANSNTVSISTGTYDKNIYGGYAVAGNAGTQVDEVQKGNTVTISGGSFKADVYGGYVNSGDGVAKYNVVNIKGGVVDGSVYGGAAPTVANVKDNTLNWSGGTIKGSAITANAINITGTKAKYLGETGTMTADNAATLAGTLTIGTGEIASTLTVTNGISIADGKTSSLVGGSTTSISSLSGGTITNAGTLNISKLNISNVISNSGTVNVAEVTLNANVSGGTLNVAGGLTQYAGTEAIGAVTVIKSGGQLDPSASYLNSSTTVESGGELYLDTGELLIDEIKGAGTTYLKSSPSSSDVETLTVKKDAKIAGTLNGNGGTIDMTGDNDTKTFTIGTLTGTTNLKIDVDMSNFTADRLAVGTITGATVNLSDINVTKDIVLTDGGILELPKEEDNKIIYVVDDDGSTAVTSGGTYTVNGSADGSLEENSVVTNNYKYTFTKGTTTDGTLKYKVEAVDLTFTKFAEGTLGDGTKDPATLSLTANMVDGTNGGTANSGAETQTNTTLNINVNEWTLGKSGNTFTTTVAANKIINLAGYTGSEEKVGTVYTGWSVVSGGTLNITGKTALNGAITNGGTLNMGGTATLGNAVTGTGTLNVTGTVDVNGKNISQKVIKMETEGASLTNVAVISGNTTDSSISVSNGTVTGKNETDTKIYGGFSENEKGAKGNTVTINNSTVANIDGIVGGYSSAAANAVVENNQVTIGGTSAISNGSGIFIRGGDNSAGAVNNNKLTINDGTLTGVTCLEGSVAKTSATNNGVTIEKGTITGLAAGMAIVGASSMGGEATKNTVTIKDGTISNVNNINAAVWITTGGTTLSLSENNLTISGGNITGISAGMKLVAAWSSDDGSASSNKVTISSGTLNEVMHIMGGYGATATSNEVNITGGSIDGIGTGMQIVGGKTTTGLASQNKVNITDGILSNVKEIYGGFSSSGAAENNTLTIDNSGAASVFTVGNLMAGRSVTGATGNILTIAENAKVQLTSSAGAVVAGFAGGNGTVSLNKVNISGGTLNGVGGIAGGITVSGRASDNEVTVNNTAVVTEVGGYSFSNYSASVVGGATLNGDAAGNKVTLATGTYEETVVGGFTGSTSSSNVANSNTVTISGGTYEGNIYGGWSVAGNAESNSVNVSGGSVTEVYGGYAGAVANSNQLTISSVNENSVKTLIAGRSMSGASNNILTINSGTKINLISASGVVIGGYAQNAGNVGCNKVTISGGTLNGVGGIAGGITASGSASDNIVTVNNTAVVTKVSGYSVSDYSASVVGGATLNGDAAGNKVTLATGTYDKIVVGGFTGGNGNANQNTVSISNGTYSDDIYGGWSVAGNAENNSITISGGTFAGSIYAGYSGNGDTSGNTISITGNSVKFVGTTGTMKADSAVTLDGTFTIGTGTTASNLTVTKGISVAAGKNSSIVDGYTGEGNISTLSGAIINAGTLNVSKLKIVGDVDNAGTLNFTGSTINGQVNLTGGTIKFTGNNSVSSSGSDVVYGVRILSGNNTIGVENSGTYSVSASSTAGNCYGICFISTNGGSSTISGLTSVTSESAKSDGRVHGINAIAGTNTVTFTNNNGSIKATGNGGKTYGISYGSTSDAASGDTTITGLKSITVQDSAGKAYGICANGMGNITVKGVSSDDKAGISVSDNANSAKIYLGANTTLILENFDLSTGSYTNAYAVKTAEGVTTLNLKDSNLAGKIAGGTDSALTINFSGTSAWTAKDNDITGKVDIVNAGTLNYTGDLFMNIGGTTGTTVLQNATVNVNQNVEVAGTLDLNGGTINMQGSSTVNTLSVGTLSGSGTINFDTKIDGANDPTIDSIAVGTAIATDTTLTLGSVNLTGSSTVEQWSVGESKTVSLVTGTDLSNLTISDITTTATSDGYSYTFKQAAAANGKVDVIKGYAGTLANIVQNDEMYGYKMGNIATYSLVENYEEINDLGTLTRVDTSTAREFTIAGNDYNFSGTKESVAHSGIQVNSGDTLNLTNISTISGWKNYVVDNAGTVNISGTTALKSVMKGAGTYNLTSGTLTVDTLTNLEMNALSIGSGATLELGSSIDQTLTTVITGGKVKLLGNVAAEGSKLADGAGNEMALNLNGKTLTVTSGNINVQVGDSTNNTGTLKISGTTTAGDKIYTAIDNDGTLTISAANILNTVDNAGTVNLTDGTLNNNITGAGTTVIDGTVDAGSKSITQGNLTINSGDKLTINTNNLIITNVITNDGELVLNSAGTLQEGVSGTGKLQVIGGTITSAKTITQNLVTINADASLDMNADLTSTNAVANSGALIISAANLKSDVENKTDAASVTLDAGEKLEKKVSGGVLNINESVSSIAANIAGATNKIADGKKLTLTGSTTADEKKLGGAISLGGTTGEVEINDAVTSEFAITANNVTIKADKSLDINADLTSTNAVANSGALIISAANLKSDVENKTDSASVTLDAGTTLVKKVSGGVLNINADVASIAANIAGKTNKIADGKKLTLTGGTTADEKKLGGAISLAGTTGKVDIDDAVTSEYAITAYNVTINTGKSLDINADLTSTNAIANSGALTISAANLKSDVENATDSASVTLDAGEKLEKKVSGGKVNVNANVTSLGSNFSQTAITVATDKVLTLTDGTVTYENSKFVLNNGSIDVKSNKGLKVDGATVVSVKSGYIFVTGLGEMGAGYSDLPEEDKIHSTQAQNFVADNSPETVEFNAEGQKLNFYSGSLELNDTYYTLAYAEAVKKLLPSTQVGEKNYMTSLVMNGDLVQYTEAGTELNKTVVDQIDTETAKQETTTPVVYDKVTAETLNGSLLVGSNEVLGTDGAVEIVAGDTSITVRDTSNTSISINVLDLQEKQSSDKIDGVVITNDRSVTVGGSQTTEQQATGTSVITVNGQPVENMKVVVGLTKSVADDLGTDIITDKTGTFTIGNGVAAEGAEAADNKYTLDGSVLVNPASSVTVNGQTTIVNGVTLNGGSLAVGTDSVLTVPTLTSTTGDSTDATVTGTVDAEKVAVESGILNVGDTIAAVISAETTVIDKCAMLLLDPEFSSGKITDATNYATNTTTLEGAYVAGRNSVLTLGTDSNTAATELFNAPDTLEALGKTWSSTGTDGGITAAAYIVKPVTLTTGSLTVDGTITSGSISQSPEAGSVTFAANSLLMVKAQNFKEAAAISGVAVDKVSINSDSLLFLEGAVKGETYKILAWSTGDLTEGKGWSDANIRINAVTVAESIYDAQNNCLKVFVRDNEEYKFEDTAAADTLIAMRRADVDTPAYQYISQVTSAVYTSAEQNANMNRLVDMSEQLNVLHGQFVASNLTEEAVNNHLTLNNGSADKEIWAQAIRTKEHVDGLGLAVQNSKYTAQYNGAVVGMDLLTKNKNTLGVALTYIDGKTNGLSGNNDSEYYGATLYGRMDMTKDTGLLYDMTFTRGKNDLQLNSGCSYEQITGDQQASSFSVGARLEQKIRTGHSTSFVPHIGARWLRMAGGSFTDSVGMNHDSESTNTLIIPVGLSFKASMHSEGWKMSFLADGGYQWNTADRDVENRVGYNGSKNSFNSTFADGNSWYAGAGFEFNRKNFTAGVGYRYSKSDSTRQNRWNVNLGWSF